MEVSIDEPFPVEPQSEPPINVIQQALMVRAFMQANPDETCQSAAAKMNIHRKRIAKLLRLIDALPGDFIEEAKKCTDPGILHKMSVQRLLRTTRSNTRPNST